MLRFIYTMPAKPWTHAGHRLDTGTPHLLVVQAKNRNTERLKKMYRMLIFCNASSGAMMWKQNGMKEKEN